MLKTAHIISFFFLPFTTFVFEFFGRRIPIAWGLISTAVALFLYPVVAPNVNLLIMCRTTIVINNSLMLGVPLVTDYIKSESRGKAAAIQSAAILFGKAFSALVLIPGSVKLDLNYCDMFRLISVCALLPIITAICLTKEPNIKKKARTD